MSYNKKLIEVALPLDAINEASAREKSIRHGHPSTLHLWWARRPLAAARAVIFAQMVDDPSAHPELFPTKEEQDRERQRLFKIIEELVKWENTTNEQVLQKARDEIWKSWRLTCEANKDHPRADELFNPDKLPAFHDPFAGGGALSLEAQRLGLEAYASDLNPVAVLINKAMIEIPPKFAGRPPVNPEYQNMDQHQKSANVWTGAQGLADDVRYYGKWMRDEAEKRIGHLYPKVEITEEMVRERPDLKKYLGQKLTVIAWIWARTVKSPNPAYRDVDVPLASTFMLSTKKGKEAWVEPIIENNEYRFIVRVSVPSNFEIVKRGTKSGGSGSSFLCLMSGTPMPFEYLRSEAKDGRMNSRLMAIVAEGDRGRVYLSPTKEMECIANEAKPDNAPETDLPEKALGFRIQEYGMKKWADLFTPRQLVALTTFSDLVKEAREQVKKDAVAAGMADDGIMLNDGGTGAQAYADAVSVYLAFALSKLADRGSTICGWDVSRDSLRNTFGRQAIPMVWDYAESNFISNLAGSYINAVEQGVKVLNGYLPSMKAGKAIQDDSTHQTISENKVISTDPPYYDNIGYADLSDFFYVWLRRTLQSILPNLFTTMAVPKAEELVATPYRHGSKDKAEAFFLNGMTQAMHRLSDLSHTGFPVSIYYAFKQSENEIDAGISSTGWETFLDAVSRAGFSVTGTWPLRTELSNRMIGAGTNALASSIIIVCRKQNADAQTITRREFIVELKKELPEALSYLQRGNIAPVDLAQSAIGPGMAVFTRYEKVIEASGEAMTVREALTLINQVLDETLAEQEGDFDGDTRWALAWFEQYGFKEAEYGSAETLSKAKNTSVSGLVEAGIISSKAGRVKLLKPDELPEGWDPVTDKRLTVWEMVHHLIRLLNIGEASAAKIAAKLGSEAETARELAYRLYAISERKQRAQDALAYNTLVQSWPEIMRLAKEVAATTAAPEDQGEMF